jgi:hypothetical protein
METTSGVSTEVAPVITLPAELSDKTFSEAELEFGIKADTGTTIVVASPFDAIYRAEDPTYIVWDKDFEHSEHELTNEVFVEYLAYLMPNLYNVEWSKYFGATAVAWATPGADGSKLGEGVAKLNEQSRRVISGETTLDQLWDQLYTPENTGKINALLSSRPRVETDVIVRTVLEGKPLPFAHGEL